MLSLTHVHHVALQTTPLTVPLDTTRRKKCGSIGVDATVHTTNETHPNYAELHSGSQAKKQIKHRFHTNTDRRQSSLMLLSVFTVAS